MAATNISKDHAQTIVNYVHDYLDKNPIFHGINLTKSGTYSRQYRNVAPSSGASISFAYTIRPKHIWVYIHMRDTDQHLFEQLKDKKHELEKSLGFKIDVQSDPETHGHERYIGWHDYDFDPNNLPYSKIYNTILAFKHFVGAHLPNSIST